MLWFLGFLSEGVGCHIVNSGIQAGKGTYSGLISHWCSKGTLTTKGNRACKSNNRCVVFVATLGSSSVAQTSACRHQLGIHAKPFGKQHTCPCKNHMIIFKIWRGRCKSLVSCPTCARLPARNGLVNEVEFLGLITQNR